MAIQVSLPMKDELVAFPEVTEVYTEGGALIINGKGNRLLVAFGPGAWLEVQPE